MVPSGQPRRARNRVPDFAPAMPSGPGRVVRSAVPPRAAKPPSAPTICTRHATSGPYWAGQPEPAARQPRTARANRASPGQPGPTHADQRSPRRARSTRASGKTPVESAARKLINVNPLGRGWCASAGVLVAEFAGSCRLFIAGAFVTMACVRCTNGFINCCGETCVTVARPPARRRGGGTPDDRAR
jgi:hypothetical protein